MVIIALILCAGSFIAGWQYGDVVYQKAVDQVQKLKDKIAGKQ